MVGKREEVPEKKPWKQDIGGCACDNGTRLKIGGRIH
jgi:hypothetical protein